jgi:glycosyltransferase involved in cell wall biosynthesis
MTEKKITILTLSDHPLSPSGVGTQTRYIVEGMLKTGRYKFVSLGGAMKHHDYQPQKTEEYGEDWIIFPVDGYGSQDQVRSILRTVRPDILWYMTDPRFYGWLWEIENEIRVNVPMVYYHVWDNIPYPQFNSKFYRSTDYIACISKVTHDIIHTLTPEVGHSYVPHAVDPQHFSKLPEAHVRQFRETHFENPEKLVFFWNNRNARRKQSGTLIWWFKEFLDEVGRDKATLIMHTDPKDVHGQDLEHIMAHLGLTNGEVMLSKEKISPEHLSMMYNMADCTINISDAEGFGLATLESLACETPIIVNMTGGLQEQVTDGENWFGIGLEPSSKAIIGSQEVPYIYEDRLNKEDFIEAMKKFCSLSPAEREEMGRLGAEHVKKNYNFDTFITQWDELLTEVHETHGSWENRKNYKPYDFKEIT